MLHRNELLSLLLNRMGAGLVMLVTLSAVPLAAEDRPVCELWPTAGCEPAMAQNVRHAAEAFRDAVAEKAAFNAKIAMSRQRMSAACRSSRLLRDHPAQIAEAQNFFALLDAKDIYFLSLTYDPVGFGPQYQAFNEMIEKSTGFGRKLDDGIRPMTIFPWSDFIDSMNRQAKRNGPTTLSGLLENYSAIYSFNKTGGYLRYRLARNLTELNACGCNLSDSPQELWSAAIAVRQPWVGTGVQGENAEATARTYYEALQQVYGAEALQQAAKKLLEAQKDKDGAIVSPAGNKEDSFMALGRFLGETSSKSYLLNVLLGWGNRFRPDQLLDDGVRYRRLVTVYGVPAVNQAAQSIREAKLDSFGRISDPQALGIAGGDLKNALFDLLALKQPGAYARAMVAFHERLTEGAAIEAAYRKLTTTYSGTAVMAASQDLLTLWKAPIDLLPQRYVAVVQERFTQEKDPGFDYDLLIKFLNKSESLPKLDGAAAGIVADPRYLAWAKFKPGASAVYAFRAWAEKDGQVIASRRPQAVDAPYQGILEVSLLKSVDAANVVVTTFDKNLVGAGTAKPLDYTYAARINKEHLEVPDQPTLVSRTSGQDTLELNGRTYACVWEKVAYRFPSGSQVVTTWKSDAIPGGLALERQENGSSDGVSVREKVLQSFPITDPAMLRTGLPVAFAITSSTNPASSTEAAKLAERSSADLVKTADGKLPPLPEGTLLKLSTDKSINAAEIAEGGVMVATLTEPILSSGQDVLYLKGTKVQLRATKGYGGLIAITAEQISRDGQSLPIRTSTFNTGLRVPVASSESQTSDPATGRTFQAPPVHIRGLTIPKISLPMSRGGGSPTPPRRTAQPEGIIPSGTNLLLLAKGT